MPTSPRGGPVRRLVVAVSWLVVALVMSSCGEERAPVKLTGFGATREDWDAHHQEAPAAVAGSRYLPMVGDKARYDFVYWELAPRAIDYGMHFPEGTTLEQAQAQLLAEFPPGSKVDRTIGANPRCLVLRVRSAPVERVITSGVPRVVLFGPEGVDTAFSRTDVRFALLGTTLDAAGEDLAGC